MVALLHVYVLLLAKSACQFLTSACLIVFADALLLADADVVLTLASLVQAHLAVLQLVAAEVHAFAVWLLRSAACSLVAVAKHEAVAATKRFATATLSHA